MNQSTKRIPVSPWCWGLLLILIHGSVYGQVLQNVIAVDTRQLFTTGYELPGTQSSRYLNPLLLSSIARLKIQTETSYDDVYRERGISEESTVYRMKHISYLELPLGAKWGGIGFEFARTDAYVHQANQFSEESKIEWIEQRASLGIGKSILQRKMMFGSQLGFTHLVEKWRPHYSLDVAWQPQTALNLELNIGRQPGYRCLEWRDGDNRYPGTMDFGRNWWSAKIRFGFLEYTNLMVEIRREYLRPADNPNTEGSFILQPEISTRSLRARAQVRPSAASSLYFKWYVSSVTGTGEAFDNDQPVGNLVSLVTDNSDLEFIGTWRRSRRSLFVFTVSLNTLDTRQIWDLDPWPFTASAIGEYDSISYRGDGQIRVERMFAEYIYSRRRAEAAVQLGRVLLIPDYLLSQSRRMPLILEPVQLDSALNITRAEFTVVGGRLSIPLGKLMVSYSFNQAFPRRIEKRDVSAAKPVDDEADIKGGGYHLLRLTLTL
jgi:hypothetical protein